VQVLAQMEMEMEMEMENPDRGLPIRPDSLFQQAEKRA
jgi:hypothetical protein